MPERTLKVIGAGPGRTGTASLKLALELLGFGPCYHMHECGRCGHAENWVRALTSGETAADEFAEIFDAHGFRAAVDFPASVVFEELLVRYPDAKVILTTRDNPHRWAQSVLETIWSPYAAERSLVLMPWRLSFQRFTRLMRARFFFEDVADSRLDDPAFLGAAFERWAAHVHKTVPPDRLLVFKPQDGWAPLCAFLDVPLPDVPYPNLNEGARAKEYIIQRWQLFAFFDAALLAVAVMAVAGLAVWFRPR